MSSIKKEDAENTEDQTSALLISKDTRSGNKEYVLDNKCRYKRDESDDKKAKGGTNGTAKTKQKDIAVKTSDASKSHKASEAN